MVNKKRVSVELRDGRTFDFYGDKELDPIRKAIGSYREKDVNVRALGGYIEVSEKDTNSDLLGVLFSESEKGTARIPAYNVSQVTIEEDSRVKTWEYDDRGVCIAKRDERQRVEGGEIGGVVGDAFVGSVFGFVLGSTIIAPVTAAILGGALKYDDGFVITGAVLSVPVSMIMGALCNIAYVELEPLYGKQKKKKTPLLKQTGEPYSPFRGYYSRMFQRTDIKDLKIPTLTEQRAKAKEWKARPDFKDRIRNSLVEERRFLTEFVNIKPKKDYLVGRLDSLENELFHQD